MSPGWLTFTQTMSLQRPFTQTRSSITVDDRGTWDARCQSLCTPNASFPAVPVQTAFRGSRLELVLRMWPSHRVSVP